jgi:hypothetical protein
LSLIGRDASKWQVSERTLSRVVKYAGDRPLPLFPGGKRKPEAKKLNAIVSPLGAVSTI